MSARNVDWICVVAVEFSCSPVVTPKGWLRICGHGCLANHKLLKDSHALGVATHQKLHAKFVGSLRGLATYIAARYIAEAQAHSLCR